MTPVHVPSEKLRRRRMSERTSAMPNCISPAAITFAVFLSKAADDDDVGSGNTVESGEVGEYAGGKGWQTL